MARNIIGIVTGLAVWLLIAALGGIIMRELWPAYASIEGASAFTLPMLFARPSSGAVATIGTGFMTACVTRSMRARLTPDVILLIGFIPVHGRSGTNYRPGTTLLLAVARAADVRRQRHRARRSNAAHGRFHAVIAQVHWKRMRAEVSRNRQYGNDPSVFETAVSGR